MRFKIIFPICLAIASGFLMTKFLYKQYDYNIDLKTVFGGNTDRAYFIEYGVFASFEEMQKEASKLSSYIYEQVGSDYYVYIGITKSRENAKKLKEYFIDNGYNIYVKEIEIASLEFLSKLYEFDALLARTTDKKAIETICNQVLAKYEELVIKDV